MKKSCESWSKKIFLFIEFKMDATKIHRSRKGTQLNDAHYFRRPLPHTRKRMTMLKIFPTLSDNKKSMDCNAKKKKRFNNLDIEQPSTEITLVSYDDQNESNQSSVSVSPHKIIPTGELSNYVNLDKDRYQDNSEILNESPSLKIEILKDNTSIETIKSEVSKELIAVLPEENSVVEVENKNDDKFEITELENNEEEIEEKAKDQIEDKTSEEDLMSNDEKLKEVHENSNNKSWWKIIIDFFGSLVGKRDFGSSNFSDRGSKKNDSFKEMNKTMTLVTAKPGNPNIYQAYVSSLASNKEKHRLKREVRTRKEKKNQHYHSDKELKNRKISSPL